MPKPAKPARHPQKTKPAPSTWDWVARADESSGLSRERIVAAAIAIADEQGLAAVSIRNVAARLGSSPMALYYHVPNKQDLLNLMLDAVHGEGSPHPERSRDCHEVLTHIAHETRRSLRRHPWVVAIRAGDPEHGPEFIRGFESVLATLAQSGLDATKATRVMGALFALANGFRAFESIHSLPAMSQPVLDAGDFPHLKKLIESNAGLNEDERFAQAVQWVLDGALGEAASRKEKR